MTKVTGLQLITNDAFQKQLKTRCAITLNGEVSSYTEFVTIGHNEVTGDTVLLNNADAVTIARAAIMIRNLFNETFSKLSEAEQEEIMSVV